MKYEIVCTYCKSITKLTKGKWNWRTKYGSKTEGLYCSHKCHTTHRNTINNPVHSPGAIAKMKQSRKGQHRGANNPNYKDGRWLYQQYRKDECEHCGKKESELTGRKKKLEVHHLDWSRTNSSPENLITVCGSCHRKIHPTNHSNTKRNKRGQFVRK